MSQFIQQVMASPYFIPVVVVVLGYVIYQVVFDKPNFPCFCDKCEAKLISDASNGDPTAQAKLQQAMYSNPLPSYLSTFGAIGWIILLGLIIGVVHIMNEAKQQTTSVFM